jgi:hypothetical protein
MRGSIIYCRDSFHVSMIRISSSSKEQLDCLRKSCLCCQGKGCFSSEKSTLVY